jgi:oligopeptidase B
LIVIDALFILSRKLNGDALPNSPVSIKLSMMVRPSHFSIGIWILLGGHHHAPPHMAIIVSSFSIDTRIEFRKLRHALFLSTEDEPSTSNAPPLAPREEDRCFWVGSNDDTAGHTNDALLGVSIPDPYGWMRDDTRTSSRVLDYIHQENEHTARQSSKNQELRQVLAKEFQQYTPNNDIGQVRSAGDFYYFTKRLPDRPYPLHCRLQIPNEDSPHLLNTTTSEYQVVLDENEIATRYHNSSYFAIHSVVPSPSHRKVAYSVDVAGTEMYDIFIQDMEAKHYFTQVASGTSGTIVWGLADDTTLYFIGMDGKTFRPYQWFRWESSSGVVTLLEEELKNDVYCDLRKSTDGQYLFWTRECPDSEVTNVSALQLSTDRLRSISFESSVSSFEHRNGYWWALFDDQEGGGTSLYTAPVGAASSDGSEWNRVDSRDDGATLYAAPGGGASDRPGWKLVELGDFSSKFDATSSILGFSVFQNHVALQGRESGLSRVWILQVSEDATIKQVAKLEFEEESADFSSVGRIQEYASGAVLITFESMVSPPQILRVNLDDPNRRRIVLQETEIPGYDKKNYKSDRLEVVSRDGKTKIPVSIVYRRDIQRPGYLHLLGYGAYGHSLEPAFSSMKLPILNRGVACAIAHVRGGGEMGMGWYRDGSGLNKMNSINDFVDVARWLTGEGGWTKPELLSCEGRSAGGLLVAAAVNQEPSLFRSVFLGVPFLDVLASMSDSSLPLTALEYGEWGNPHEIKGFESIRRYSPVQNIQTTTRTQYPSFWIAASLHDPRTPYWESLKFGATLRYAATTSPDDRPICVKIADAGHSLGSNRTKYFEEMGCIYAFLLDQLKG